MALIFVFVSRSLIVSYLYLPPYMIQCIVTRYFVFRKLLYMALPVDYLGDGNMIVRPEALREECRGTGSGVGQDFLGFLAGVLSSFSELVSWHYSLG